MKPAVVRAELECSGVDHLPTQTYIVNALRLGSDYFVLDCTTEVTRKIFKELRAVS